MDNVTCTCNCRDGGRERAPVADDRGSVSRRGVLAGSAAVVATLALGACAAKEEPAASGGTAAAGTPAGSEGASGAASTPSAESGEPSTSATGAGSGETGQRLAGTGDFPVGGGVVVTTDSGPVVVTHPADDEFVAFNGKCPHQGCPVAEVTENTIVCTCHGSTFDGSTGTRLEGPAPVGLEPVAITVEGDGIYLA